MKNKLKNNKEKSKEAKPLKHIVQNENTSLDATQRRQALLSLSTNIVHWTLLYSLGNNIPSNLQKSLNVPVINFINTFEVHKCYANFDRRVTTLAWHPTEPNTVAIGSKGGDIVIWNYENGDMPKVSIEGPGPGGSIQAFKFNVSDPSVAYTSSVIGTLSRHDLNMGIETVYLNYPDCDQWFTSLDVSNSGRSMLAGDNKGNVNLLTIDGEKMWEKKLHKKKVSHIEFNPNGSWCFVTTSVDRELKIWDIRKIKDKNSFTFSDTHRSAVNSAYFSRTDGGTLLTTDQSREIRVYSVLDLRLLRSIDHPHRGYQHLTPIKATWHPLKDIIVVGRYPEASDDDIRSIDFFDASTGRLLHQHLRGSTGHKIVSLNEFNDQGDALLSACGSHALLWKPNFSSFESKEKESSFDDDNDEKENCKRASKRKRSDLDLCRFRFCSKKK